MIDAMLKIFAIDATRKVTTILFYHLLFNTSIYNRFM